MPKCSDINSVLVIGSGPIVIGQACEFDYSGTQACLTLKKEGCRVILVNSNPATIMTDPEFSDRTYVEPLDAATIEAIIKKEHPDAILPTMGGQTALNVAVELAESGVLDREGVRLIGCDLDTIRRGEDRKMFADCMEQIGLEMCRSDYAYSLDDARRIAAEIGYPCVVRPSFTLGGAGGGIAHDQAELEDIVAQGLELSAVGEVLIEESIEGWKEFEMEAMRDKAGNGIIVCSIENLDPMGVHTGDSITVAPIQTLTDVEYQRMRDATLAILDVVGVQSGGSNVQFALNPNNGRMVVIEMNPRVSRSSALASKATGYPIAKVATQLALGYTLDELANDVTKTTTAAFEPSIDYCVVKIPRFAFEKFQGADETLTTRMKAVGEVMAVGRTFEEAFGKAMRSLEQKGCDNTVFENGLDAVPEAELEAAVRRPTSTRITAVLEALRRGWDVERLYALSGIDPYFLHRLAGMVALQQELAEATLADLNAEDLLLAKRMGLSDRQLGVLLHESEAVIRAVRKVLGVTPVFRMIDTCAAEFGSSTAYYYKTYDNAGTDAPAPDDRTVMILGSGPNRIGQGIEFDYCCVQACLALRKAGYTTMMVNCNPETVSTDYNTADILVFEPLTYEDVMDIVDTQHPQGAIVTLGGQTPLKLAKPLTDAGVRLLGTGCEAIDMAEDRERFAALLDSLNISYPASGMAATTDEARAVAARIGYPLIVRPSYVLGGQGMAIVHNAGDLERYVSSATQVSGDRPIYLDKFLESAVEVDVDALSDGTQVYIGGIMEHIEMAGVHSGDSASSIPPISLSDAVMDQLRAHTTDIALALGVEGLINVQFAIKDTVVYVIEANPRASRTVPFISKASGVSLAQAASLVMVGKSIADQALPSDRREWQYCCAKEAVMPWDRFVGASVVLSPEMKSTGEVMGIATTFPAAFAKAQVATNFPLPQGGVAFVSVCDADKRALISIARELCRLGFSLVSTKGTGRVLERFGLPCEIVGKVHEGSEGIVGRMAKGEVDLVINSPFGSSGRGDGDVIRNAAVRYGICYMTTMAGAQALVAALDMMRGGSLDPVALQDIQLANGGENA